MSADAVGWTYRHSPYNGVTFQVHQAVADSVNDQHGNEFWMVKPKLALKARTSVASAKRAMETLVAEGFLELLEESAGRGGSRYRFMFPETAVIYDSRSTGSPRTGSTSTPQPAHQNTPTGSPASKNAPYKEGSQENPSRTQGESVLFDAFWTAYPRSEEKGKARIEWKSAIKKAPPEVIIAAVERYAADPTREHKYTPYPAKWLKGERWEDDPTPSGRGQNPSSRGAVDNTRTFASYEEFKAWQATQK